ncbi:MAG: gcvH, partial [Rhodospirillaceae bacterium]
VEKGEEVAVLDSAKAAGEIYAPMTGIVVAVNEALIQNPALVNTDPLGEGWIVRLRLTRASEEAGALMDADTYAGYVSGLA